MALAKALGIPVVRGCEVQCGDGMRTLMHVGFASQVANLGGVFDATYKPIEDPEVQVWRDTDDANYDNVGAAALYTFSFDVGKSAAAAAAAASMMIPCHALLLLLCTAIWYLMPTPADDLLCLLRMRQVSQTRPAKPSTSRWAAAPGHPCC